MKVKGLRWWVVCLVALAAVINYIDRQAFGALWPNIAKDLFPEMGPDDTKVIYATISAVFILSYAAGQTIFGKIFDWIGTRIGFALSIGIWSIATMIHVFAKGMISFSIFRSILGIAEAGNWPGAAKANAEWFPTKERAFAQGIFNSGAAIGGIVAYPVIGLLSAYLEWKAIFLCVGLLGLLWLLPWLFIVKSSPEKHPWLSEDEKKYILSGQKNQDIDEDGDYDDGYNPTTGKLLKHKESWGVIIASAAIDPIWWLFIVWIPIYLNEVFGLNVKEIAFSAWVPYVGAMLGAWFGGLLAQNRLSNGWSVDKTRKMVITLGCLIMIPCFFLLKAPGSAMNAVIIMAVLLFGFQTAIGNVQTLPSDMFSGKIVGTLSGFAGTAAKLGAFGLTILIPILTKGGNYTSAFLIGGALSAIALMAVWVLCPKIEPLKPKLKR
ncbi:major facilitator superfamily MFS_1 [Cellulophaga algicola DSM 14237]|uniref:Major facilitator superfamily MFS_1 n=1 Tax=Cellulophaga algicola (strain DSM 14237 / IC166 / ACAM 630) TaxID=688270 RepID=E6XFI2_CELAD|nr:MFS transporter [Cellulophaga algicola]ADV51455.1 major facilitator superfamily MFS_1 [Cellulophaga algicola DSM 14237]